MYFKVFGLKVSGHTGYKIHNFWYNSLEVQLRWLIFFFLKLSRAHDFFYKEERSKKSNLISTQTLFINSMKIVHSTNILIVHMKHMKQKYRFHEK